MTRYVALSTDANPHYAVYAPIVVKLWQALGYEPILFLHDQGWDTPLGELVRTWLGVPPHLVARCAPLTTANTMRLVRIVAAAKESLDTEALLLTSDIDMAPLSSTFFDRAAWPPFCLRADAYGPFHTAHALHGFFGEDPGPQLRAGEWRFPLCYVGMPVRLWRELLQLEGTPETCLQRLVQGRGDAADHDEAITSRAILSSTYADGILSWQAGHLWRQGAFDLVAVQAGPESKGGHARMLIHGQGRKRTPVWADAVDFHMPRPATMWIGESLSRLWPGLKTFILDYWQRVSRVAKLRG